MDTDKHGFKHSEITDKIIKVFFEAYNELGHGFLESVYERSLEIALNSLGLRVVRQIEIPVWFRGTVQLPIFSFLIMKTTRSSHRDVSIFIGVNPCSSVAE